MKILLLEDNEDFVKLIKLAYSNEKIINFSSIREGTEWLHFNRPDLILIDLGLDDSYGINTLIQLQNYKVPKIVITANTNLNIEALKYGVTDYILKQGNIADIYTRISFNLEKFRPKRNLKLHPDTFEQIKTLISVENKLTFAS